MKILAFDLSMSRTGYAVGDQDGSVDRYGSIELWYKGGENEGRDFFEMQKLLRDLIQEISPKKVIFAEFTNTPNVLSGHASIGLRGILLMTCYHLTIPCEPVSEIRARKNLGVDLTTKLLPDEERNWVSRMDKWQQRGKKTAKPKRKRDMKARVDKRLSEFGWQIENDDARDAVVLILGKK